MSTQGMVAIVTPVHNSQATLYPTILSALHQKHLHRHILVDDGSTDESFAIIREHSDRYESIIPIRRERSTHDKRTSSNAMNIGLASALSYPDVEYVTRLDSDDILSRNSLALRMAQFEPSVGIVFSWHDGFNSFGRYPTYSHKLKGGDLISKRTIFSRLLPFHTLVWSRRLLEMMEPAPGFTSGTFYDPSLDYHEDLEFTLRLLDALNRANMSLVYVDAVTLHQRHNPFGISGRAGFCKRLSTTRTMQKPRSRITTREKIVFDVFISRFDTILPVPCKNFILANSSRDNAAL